MKSKNNIESKKSISLQLKEAMERHEQQKKEWIETLPKQAIDAYLNKYGEVDNIPSSRLYTEVGKYFVMVLYKSETHNRPIIVGEYNIRKGKIEKRKLPPDV